MKVLDLLRAGVRSLWLRKFRTFLTILGVLFGVSAVITMAAIGTGAREEAIATIEKFGATTIILQAKKLEKDKIREALRKGSTGLSKEDLEYLMAVCSFIEGGTALFEAHGAIKYGGIDYSAALFGIEPNYFELTRLPLQEGRIFRQEDFTHYQRVCLLGSEIAQTIFQKTPPLGKKILIGSYHYEIIGILAKRELGENKLAGGGGMAVKTRNIGLDILLPQTTASSLLTKPNELASLYSPVKEILLKMKHKDVVLPSKEIIEKIINRRHRNFQDYELIVPLEILQQSQATIKIFNMVMLFIASLALLIGGIGIMNIMLANVSERTQEIGIRRAIGASQNDILVQFLLEAILISGGGGIAGIIFGKILSEGISLYAGWKTIIPPEAILIGFSVSAAVGVLFGIFPASKASRLDPIEALRSD